MATKRERKRKKQKNLINKKERKLLQKSRDSSKLDSKKIKDVVFQNIDEQFEFNRNFRKSALNSKEIEELLALANDRWQRIESIGNYSRAIQRALDENNDIAGFSIEEKNSPEEILAELQRAKTFINDFTSTLKGSEWWTQEMYISSTLGLFGSKFKATEGKAYSSHLQEDFLKEAFRVYRSIEDDLGSELIREYGSDRLVNYLYSSIEWQGDFDESSRVGLYNEGIRKIDEMLDIKYGQFSKAFNKENEVGFIADYFQDIENEFENTIKERRDSIWDYL